MWVLHSCGDVELELVVVWDFVISDLHAQLAANLDEGLVEKMVEGWI